MSTPEYKFQSPFLYYGYDPVSLRQEFNALVEDYNDWQINDFPSNDRAKLLARIEYAKQILAPNIYENGSNADALKACENMKAFVESKST